MTYQQQEIKPYIKPPKSPIPPLVQMPGQKEPPIAYSRPCKFCNEVQVIIKRERISDDWNGQPRHRYVPRNSKTDEIHNCLMKFNVTKKESELS